MPRPEQSLMAARKWRIRWQETGSDERAGCSEAKALFEALQGLPVKSPAGWGRDERALLQRGLLPLQHLPRPPRSTPTALRNIGATLATELCP